MNNGRVEREDFKKWVLRNHYRGCLVGREFILGLGALSLCFVRLGGMWWFCWAEVSLKIQVALPMQMIISCMMTRFSWSFRDLQEWS